MSWGNFKQGYRCPYCARLKVNFEDIKKEFEKRKYKLLTKYYEYKNCYTKLNYICPKGHKSSIAWSSFQQGHGCPYCAGKKIDFIDIKNEFEKRKYILLTEEKEYKDAHKKLNYICQNNHKHSITWDHFKQGQNCPYCYKIRMKLNKIGNINE
jgi:rubredoxin